MSGAAARVIAKWLRVLQTLWSTTEALARNLRLLLGAEILLPARAEPDPNALAALEIAADMLRAECRDHVGDLRLMIDAARANGVLHKGRPKDKTLSDIWAALAAFGGGAPLSDDMSGNLELLTPAGIAARVLGKHKGTARIDSPLLHAVANYLDVRRAAARAYAEARASLLHDVRDIALARMAAIKRERGLTGFDDLVERVYAALSSEHGERLAAALREDYPAALVDEFQDTDAKQWSIFRRIYVGSHEAPRPALFLIGDPKQAIYRFRGGDVHTYHEAGRDAESTQTLDRNFRSRPRMIEAVAAVFAEGGALPFADDETRYPRVVAGGRIADGDLVDGKRIAPALHLLNLSRSPSAPRSAMRAQQARDLAAQAAATEIHRLLTASPLTIRAGDTQRRIVPGDIAVLVSRNDEAVRMQRELAARGIASVTATRTSLFSTPEATEIVRILEALLAIGDESRLRAALATVLVGVDGRAIDALSRDEDAHRGWLDAFSALASALAALGSARISLGSRRGRGAAFAQACRRRATAHELPATCRSRPGSAHARARRGRSGRLARTAHRIGRRLRRRAAASARIRRRARAHHDAAQGEGAGVRSRVPSVRGHGAGRHQLDRTLPRRRAHRRQARVARAHRWARRRRVFSGGSDREA